MNILYGLGRVTRKATVVDLQKNVREGWSDIIARLVADLEELGWNGVVLQVKEKFGGLRFYISDGSEAIKKRVHQAEAESYFVCEFCGEPGVLRETAWLKTLCDSCHTIRQEARAIEDADANTAAAEALGRDKEFAEHEHSNSS